MSAPEGEPPSDEGNEQEQQEEVPENDQPQGSTPAILEISGGHHGMTNIGGRFGQYIRTQVNKTYNTVGASAKPQRPEQYQVSCLITVCEKDPISLSSRIFKGSLHSDVTGDRDAAIKITAALTHNFREAKIFFSVPHHKNIVERFATDTFNLRGQPSIFMAMERCDCNLYDHVKSEIRDRVEFDAEKYTWIAYQILVGLNFLHSLNVVHGDLKPANVLLILNGNIVKLSDFGLSRAAISSDTSSQSLAPQGATTGWQAPEILKGSSRISKATDIFPCGLTLYFVWSYAKHPYGRNPVSLNHYIMIGINPDLSRMRVPFIDIAKDLLTRMLLSNPVERPTAAEILQSSIFNRYGPHESRYTGPRLAEFLDQTITLMRDDGNEAGSLNEEAITPFGVTERQFANAMEAFLHRNWSHLSQRFTVPQQSGEREPEATNPKQFFVRVHPSTSNIGGETLTRVGRRITMEKSSAPLQSEDEGPETTNPKKVFVSIQSSTRNFQVETSQHVNRRTAIEDASVLQSEVLQIPGQSQFSLLLPKQDPPLAQQLTLSSERLSDATPIPALVAVPKTTSKFRSLLHVLRFQKRKSKVRASPPPRELLAEVHPRQPNAEPRQTASNFLASSLRQSNNDDSHGNEAKAPQPGELSQLQHNTPIPKQFPMHQSARVKDGFDLETRRWVSAQGTPLCQRSCNFIFVSKIVSEGHHFPLLTSQIYGLMPHGSHGHALCPKVDHARIQEELLRMPTCDKGITMIIISGSFGSWALARALQEGRLSTFLEQKGFSGEDQKQKIQKHQRKFGRFHVSAI